MVLSAIRVRDCVVSVKDQDCSSDASRQCKDAVQGHQSRRTLPFTRIKHVWLLLIATSRVREYTHKVEAHTPNRHPMSNGVCNNAHAARRPAMSNRLKKFNIFGFLNRKSAGEMFVSFEPPGTAAPLYLQFIFLLYHYAEAVSNILIKGTYLAEISHTNRTEFPLRLRNSNRRPLAHVMIHIRTSQHTQRRRRRRRQQQVKCHNRHCSTLELKS